MVASPPRNLAAEAAPGVAGAESTVGSLLEALSPHPQKGGRHYGVTEGVLKEVQHETVEEALDAKQGLGRKWRGEEGSMPWGPME